MFAHVKAVLQAAMAEFLATDAPSRGAAIAFYTVTSFVPVLVIVIAIAGFAFGEEAARGAIVAQMRGLLGEEGALLVENAVRNASRLGSGLLAVLGGVAVLVATSSGVFVELRNGLNAIWRVEKKKESVSHFLKARAASLGLVIALGFLLLVSLVAHAAIAALILPERELGWRDVIVGATVTAFLFEAGKVLIGLYVGSGGAASSFGAAGALIALLFWVYYSAQIVLFGAATTEAILASHGKKPPAKAGAKERAGAREPRR
jgi:membrane protein